MNFPNFEYGVLNNKQLRFLIDNDFIINFDKTLVENENYKDIDGSSLDLHITNEIRELKFTEKLEKRKSLNDIFGSFPLYDITKGLFKEHIYLIKLKEKIDFKKYCGKYGLYGRTSGRSSIGRLDILTRLIVDNYPKYDEIPPNYCGSLYLEVIPLSFYIKLPEGYALNQLRVFHGKPELSVIQNDELYKYAPMLYIDDGNPVLHDYKSLRVDLTEDKTTNGDPISYRANKLNTLTVDLNSRTKLNPNEFWYQEKKIDKEKDYLLMEKEEFYILRSYERMHLPNDVAVTCIAYSENLGELRIHYAGFAHPNFGHHGLDKLDKKIGAPLIFEARCHSFKVKIRHKEQFARIEYYKMSEFTEATSKYSNQELKLSAIFADW